MHILMHAQVATLSVIHILFAVLWPAFFLLGTSVVGPLEKKKKKIVQQMGL